MTDISDGRAPAAGLPLEDDPVATLDKALACSVCARAAFFQARIEYPAGPQFVRRRAPVCASHLVQVMQALGAWARSHGLVGGQLTVLAIDPYALPRLAALGVADPGLAFYFAPITRASPAAGPATAGAAGEIRYAQTRHRGRNGQLACLPPGVEPPLDSR